MPDHKFRRRNSKDRFFYLLAIWLVAVFLLGGGSRGDVWSLVLLRPLAGVMLVVGSWGLTRSELAPQRVLVGLAVAIGLLALVQLVPLPPFAWEALPGRAIVARVDAVTSLGAVWRPISLSPSGAWNAAFSLLVPFSVLIMGLRQTPPAHEGLVNVVIALCGLSALLGLAQVLGPADGPLYFYRITNAGDPVGLFSNRNHHAALLACALPLAALFAAGGDRSAPDGGQSRLLGALAIVLLVLPVLLATGSRAGLLLAAAGVISMPFIYGVSDIRIVTHRGSSKQSRRRFWVGLLTFGLILAGLTALFADNQSLARFGNTGSIEEQRLRGWPVVVAMIGKYFPVGSGFGSFDQVFRIDEPLAMVRHNYFNHAHNDWLEMALTGGLPATLLALGATIAWARAVWRVVRLGDRRTATYRRGLAGGAIILILAAASVVDYPLRTPSLAVVFTIAALWLSAAAASVGQARRENL